jgi:hypothetical protein
MHTLREHPFLFDTLNGLSKSVKGHNGLNGICERSYYRTISSSSSSSSSSSDLIYINVSTFEYIARGSFPSFKVARLDRMMLGSQV